MTELEYKINSLETAIKVIQNALMKSKNSRMRARERARDTLILAGFYKDLEELKAQHLEECIKAATESFRGVDTDEFGNLMRGNE